MKMTEQFEQLSKELGIVIQNTHRWLKLQIAIIVMMTSVMIYGLIFSCLSISIWIPWFACWCLAGLGTQLSINKGRPILDQMDANNKQAESDLYKLLTGEEKR